jgi:type I restriction-modification system DNA methylase subunit
MSIFQKSVINNHLSQLDLDQVDKAFEKFNENYSFSKIAEIQKMKEEEYQDGFLRDIFVDVFGYTLKPADNYNLAREYKNQTDGKKADGAILKNDKAIAVIELKSTKTKDLINVTQQAFNYKNNQPECKYVITSNFQKLRFYIDYSNEYEEFDLFNLPKDNFQLLYLLLQKDSILTDLPLKLKTETKFHEENISDKLYKDYSSFKYKIYNNLVKNNPQYDRLTLFKKSQKFLDRLLFVFFAEDTGLVPPNAISKIVEQWQLFIDNDEYFSLYSRFVKFFIHLDKGHKYKTYDLPAYNGGLFAPDEILDNITIDDNVLKSDALLLSSYDYSTEVDVNILGHIFEHSLNEIEEITAEIEGTATDKNKTKRKKDGVFYTPKYITQYIVENTIGKLCIEKREKLGILEIEFDESVKTKNGKISAAGKKLFETLQAYKDWLFSLKIVDPACGSGAFLNQALNFLINEHQQIDDIIAELTGEKLRLFDTDKTILEKNLYGVDINDESVEIAKLSLWLRTAQKGRKLSKLNNNIKCGNSLLSSEFDWHNEFAEIMKHGGFDVVIGNPPYIKEATNKSAFDGLHEHPCYQGKMDLWYFFGALALDIIKKDYGLIGYIAPNNWITNDGASKFRDYIIDRGRIVEFIDFSDFKVFDSAGIQTMIYIMKRTNDNANYSLSFSKVVDSKIKHEDAQLFLEKLADKKYEYFTSNIFKAELINKPIHFINASLNLIIDRIIAKANFNLESKEIASGIDLLQDFVNKKHKEVIGNVDIGDGIFNLSQTEYDNLNLIEKEKKLIKPFYTTTELLQYYGNPKNKLWIIYTDSSFKDEKKILPYPNIKEHLDKFLDIFTSVNKPYGLHRSRDEKYFKGEKIFSLRKCSVRPRFTFTDFDAYVNRTFMVIKTNRINQKYLTGILNSNLIAFWLKYKGKMQGNNFQIDKTPLENLPLINPSTEIQEKISHLVQSIIFNKQKSFDYLELLEKAKKENNFDREILLIKEAEFIHAELTSNESEINNIIYRLYDLTDEEIAIVENSIK